MTSLCGFDALLRNKKVVTFGIPFYAGWGLTEDRNISFEVMARRHRRLSLDELIAGTLLYYPVYWDWTFKGYTDCLSVVRQIVNERNILEQTGELKNLEIGFIRRQVRKIHALISGLVDFS
jgi:capsular polysaccharide export protein